MTKREGVWLWLALCKGFGARRAKELVETMGGEEALWDAPFSALCGAMGQARAEKLWEAKNPEAINAHVKMCRALGIGILTPASPGYPERLKELYDPPCTLYVRGDEALLSRDALTVVGTRRLTRYGEKMTRALAGDCAAAGLVIVSGLALGADTAAHEAALQNDGGTIAVLGCGLSVFYPPENIDLQREIASRGLLVSEFPPDEPPERYHFPARNRILAALGRGVLVTEAGEKSGALITAECAMDLGREVFAVPGNADADSARGSNALLKDGAVFVTGARDILQALSVEAPIIKKESPPRAPLTQEEETVAAHIQREPQSFDQLAALTGFSAAKLNSLLTMLQLKGIIVQSAGRVFTTKF